MHYRNWLILGALAIVGAGPLSGCGDNDNEIFLNCGNGTVDSGEQCDDGNSVETDACLSTCRSAECGDGFIETGFEACDGSNLNGASCSSLGLGSGTVSCNASCDFDTSGCGANPVPTFTATPVVGPTPTTTVGPTDGITPTPGSSDEPTPIPTATSGGGPACGSAPVVLNLTLSVPVGGAQVQLAYPASVRIPGTGGDPDVVGSVDLPPGLPSVNDEDTNADLVDDRLSLAWVTSGGEVTNFATVTFECVPGQSIPSEGDFTCTVTSASGESGNDLTGVTCDIAIQ